MAIGWVSVENERRDNEQGDRVSARAGIRLYSVSRQSREGRRRDQYKRNICDDRIANAKVSIAH